MVRNYSKIKRIAAVFCFLFLTPFLLSSQSKKNDKIIIVIDAGHGGHNYGAVGKHFGTKEKDVNLSVSKYLYNYLKKNPKFHPILVRNKDYFIPLKKRAQVSNHFKPDLFISIHCNQPGSNRNTHTNGSEVYYLSKDKVVNQENRRKSILVSYKILEGLEKSLNFNKRRVLPQNFSVLRNTNAVSPSILVEIAFLSNYDDEFYIKQTKNQKVIALSIYNSLKNHYL